MALNGRLHICTGLRNGKTFLENVYCTPPFKIADITEDKEEKRLILMVMSSSPGILNGDVYHISIDVNEDCTLEMHTQAYQRLLNMQQGALQQMEVRMKNSSHFTYLPQPVVPHEGSNFTSRNKIYINQNCSLIWGEVLSCGRKLNGERFAFSKYHSVTEIYMHEKLVVKENLLVIPKEINVDTIGQWEGFTHQASLIMISENINTPKLVASLTEMLSEEKDIVTGMSALPVNGVMVRMFGTKAEQLFDLVNKMAAFHFATPILIKQNACVA